jgi:hypothetical protein
MAAMQAIQSHSPRPAYWQALAAALVGTLVS